jgi:hypothetical protein
MLPATMLLRVGSVMVAVMVCVPTAGTPAEELEALDGEAATAVFGVEEQPAIRIATVEIIQANRPALVMELSLDWMLETRLGLDDRW